MNLDSDAGTVKASETSKINAKNVPD
jgi:hypothetical protein